MIRIFVSIILLLFLHGVNVDEVGIQHSFIIALNDLGDSATTSLVISMSRLLSILN